jgi:phosphotransferase system HPr (HPr) family protein
MTCSEKVIVKQPYGLHLRAAVKLILASRKYKSRIIFKKGKSMANSQSILGIMNLAAAHGTELEVISEGEDAREALAEIRGLFDHPQSWS